MCKLTNPYCTVIHILKSPKKKARPVDEVEKFVDINDVREKHMTDKYDSTCIQFFQIYIFRTFI